MKILKKVLFMSVGLLIMAVAMAILSAARLGTSPVQSLSYVISQKFPDVISFGTASITWNFILVGLQLLLLRKQFRLLDLLQIPLSLYFGLVIDLAESWISFTPVGMVARVLTMVLGVIVLAIGIFLTVEANLVMNSGEAAVKAIAGKTKKNFGSVKVVFDVTIVSSALLASLILFGKFRWDMVGVGTVCCALFTGFLVKALGKIKGWMKHEF